MSRRWSAAERRQVVLDTIALVTEQDWALHDALRLVAKDHQTHAAIVARIIEDHGFPSDDHAAFLRAVREHAATRLASRAAKAEDLTEIQRLANAARAVGPYVAEPRPKKSKPEHPRPFAMSPAEATRRALEIKRNLERRKAAAR